MRYNRPMQMMFALLCVLFLVTQASAAPKNKDPQTSEKKSDQSKTFNNAGTLLVQGKFDEAIKEYTKEIAANPKNSKAYNNRAIVYHKLGQFDKAIEDY